MHSRTRVGPVLQCSATRLPAIVERSAVTFSHCMQTELPACNAHQTALQGRRTKTHSVATTLASPLASSGYLWFHTRPECHAPVTNDHACVGTREHKQQHTKMASPTPLPFWSDQVQLQCHQLSHSLTPIRPATHSTCAVLFKHWCAWNLQAHCQHAAVHVAQSCARTRTHEHARSPRTHGVNLCRCMSSPL